MKVMKAHIARKLHNVSLYASQGQIKRCMETRDDNTLSRSSQQQKGKSRILQTFKCCKMRVTLQHV